MVYTNNYLIVVFSYMNYFGLTISVSGLLVLMSESLLGSKLHFKCFKKCLWSL